jgi:hypothetical protein
MFVAWLGSAISHAKQNTSRCRASRRGPVERRDFLAALSGRLMPNTYTDVAWQYDPREGKPSALSWADAGNRTLPRW